MQIRAWSPHMPGLHCIQVVDRIKMVDNTNVIEKSWKCTEVNCFGLCQVHIHYRLSCHRRIQQLFNLVNVLISKFFTGQKDRRTD